MTDVPSTPIERSDHWDGRYGTVGSEHLSWFESEPTTSLHRFDRAGVGTDASVIDVGGGTSALVDALIDRGHSDLAVLDVSGAALDEARQRVGDGAPVEWIHQDLLVWQPGRRWHVWHDRAVFHFLVRPEDRATYRELIARAVTPGGLIVVGTFASDGPESCSGLPVQRYGPDELVAELGPGLEVVEATRVEHHTPGGAVQPFTWVVVRAPAAG